MTIEDDHMIRLTEVGKIGDRWLANPRSDDGSLKFDAVTDRGQAEHFTLPTARAIVACFNNLPDRSWAAIIVRSDLPT